jgi:eukaryotic-like serine/threonine-protein kinase
VFTRAFTAGLHDASLNGRVTEGTWRRVLLALQDSVYDCPACRAALFHDPEQAGQRCWNCSAPLPVPVTLKLAGSLLVLSAGAVLTSHHLNRDRDHRTACAVVEPDPRQAGRVVLRNRTDRSWTVVPDGEEAKRVAPGQRLGVRPMRIDFGPARGQIRAGEIHGLG